MGFGIWCPLHGSISIEKDSMFDIKFFHISSQMKCTPISHKVVGFANLLFLCLIFTRLELEFTKLKFHMDFFFFFNYNSMLDLD